MVRYSDGSKNFEQLALSNSNIGRQDGNQPLGKFSMQVSLSIKDRHAKEKFTRSLKKVPPKFSSPNFLLKMTGIL